MILEPGGGELKCDYEKAGIWAGPEISTWSFGNVHATSWKFAICSLKDENALREKRVRTIDKVVIVVKYQIIFP